MSKVPARPYKVKHKPRIPQTRGTDDLERWCMSAGFACKEKAKWLQDCEDDPSMRSDPPRFTYRTRRWRMLTPSYECPFWTLQCGSLTFRWTFQ